MEVETEGFGGEYGTVRDHLTDQQLLKIIRKIADSDRFEMGELSHIVLAGTETIVGYVGSQSAELCCSPDVDAKTYQIPYHHLKRIFRSV